MAAVHGMSSTVQQLLDSGASINYGNSNRHGSTNHTALYTACDYNHPETAKILINSVANVNIASEKGTRKCTPLYRAVKNGMRSTVELLMSKGARTDIDFPNNFLYAAKKSRDQFLV